MITSAKTKRWTREEYHRLGEQGWFDRRRVELVEGEIVEMSPQSEWHFACVARVQRVLERLFGNAYWVRVQGPIDINGFSEPEPDLAVVKGQPGDYRDHPSAAVLVVEIASTTRDYDLGEKASLYAKGGIRDYWVLDIARRELHVHREPAADASKPMGFGCRGVRVLSESDRVEPLATPGMAAPVSAMLG